MLDDSLNFEEELKQIDVCGLGPLRVTSALFNAGLLQPGAKVARCCMGCLSIVIHLPQQFSSFPTFSILMYSIPAARPL